MKKVDEELKEKGREWFLDVRLNGRSRAESGGSV